MPAPDTAAPRIAGFFSNGKLWLALGAVLALQAVAVLWAPAQAVFDTVDLSVSGMAGGHGDGREHAFA